MVRIVFGSISDKTIMDKASAILEKFGVYSASFVISAHRAPDLLARKLKTWEDEKVKVIIAGAGLAAHLPGVIASKTIIPVIGVPIKSELDGMDALLSIVQMPPDIPVATVGINNAKNAALLALQMLAISDFTIKQKLIDYRSELAQKMEENHEL